MADADFAVIGGQDQVARLRALLAALESTVPLPRTDPRSQKQLALCAEVEAIVRQRHEERAGPRTA